MEFTCKTINLREAIIRVERIVSKQITLPILANILIKTEKGRLSIASTNLEIAIKTFIGAKIEKEGEITIPSRIIGGFLASIKDEVIEGSLKGSDLELKSGNHLLKIKGMDAKDYPLIPKNTQAPFLKIDQAEISKFISSTLISVAHNDARQELNGVLMKLNKDSVVLAATDSFRLSESVINFEKNTTAPEYLSFIDKNPFVIIPALTLSEIGRVSKEGSLSLGIEQNQLFISGDNFRIVSRLVNGNYPEYQQVLPKKYEIEIIVNKDELINAVKIASLVASGQNNEIKISGKKDGDSIQISAQSMDTGDDLSKVSAKINGPEFDIVFNSRYLFEGITTSALGESDIILKLNQQKSPVLLRGADAQGKENRNFSYIVMPIIKS